MAPLLDEAYIQTGKVYFVYKEFPVLGQKSVMGSFAAQCAADQGKFWEMHDWLFQNAGSISPDALKQAARDLGLDGAAFDACFDAQTPRPRIQEDFDEGRRWGARGTPTFFINGRIIGGLLPKDQFLQIVDAALAEAQGGDLPAGVALPTPEPTPDLDFEPETYAVMGDPNAPITMVEFSDYQCPFCLRYFNNTLEQVKKNYVETGKVFYVFKDFPITQIHPQAPKAAEAAECAGDQGRYWEMHDRLFQGQQPEWNQNPDAVTIFKGYAQELGLDMDAFNDCLDSGQYTDEVAADLDEGVRAGVTGTPSFFINGQMISGAQPYEAFQRVLDSLLAEGTQ